MIFLFNIIIWGVLGIVLINYVDVICFILFRGCFFFNLKVKMERVKKME